MIPTRPCPKCVKLDRLVLEQDTRSMTEYIRCTRCRRKSPVTPITPHAHQEPPNALAGWNALPRTRQLSLFDTHEETERG